MPSRETDAEICRQVSANIGPVVLCLSPLLSSQLFKCLDCLQIQSPLLRKSILLSFLFGPYYEDMILMVNSTHIP